MKHERCTACGSQWHSAAMHGREPAWLKHMQSKGLPAKDMTATSA